MSATFPRPLAGLDLEAGVLVERWICRKADGYISPGRLPFESGEKPAAWLRRQWWAVIRAYTCDSSSPRAPAARTTTPSKRGRYDD